MMIFPETTRNYRDRLYSDPTCRNLARYQANLSLFKIVEEVYKHGLATNSYSIHNKNPQLSYFLHCGVELEQKRFPCSTVFAGVLGICKNTLQKARKRVLSGMGPATSAKHEKELRVREKSPLYMAVHTYVHGLACDMANESPDMKNTELPSGTKQNYYDMFVEEWKSGVLTGCYFRNKLSPDGPPSSKPPSRSLFYSIWKSEFGGLVVPRTQNRFSKCDTCIAYKAQLEDAKKRHDIEGVKAWKTRLYAHYRWVTLHRKKYHWHRRKAKEDPNTYMSIIMDAMDAQKCNIPHAHNHPKGWEGNKMKMSSQIIGFIIHGVGTRGFVVDEELKKDANLTVTLLLKVLADEKTRREAAGIPWPKVLYLQVDSGPDNKNKELFSFGELLVRLGIFTKVKFSFLPVGHTHEDIDAFFGAGSHMIHNVDVCTLKEMAALFFKGWPSTKSFHWITVGFLYMCLVNLLNRNVMRMYMVSGETGLPKCHAAVTV